MRLHKPGIEDAEIPPSGCAVPELREMQNVMLQLHDLMALERKAIVDPRRTDDVLVSICKNITYNI